MKPKHGEILEKPSNIRLTQQIPLVQKRQRGLQKENKKIWKIILSVAKREQSEWELCPATTSASPEPDESWRTEERRTPEENPMTGVWQPYPQPRDPTPVLKKQHSRDPKRTQKDRSPLATSCKAHRRVHSAPITWLRRDRASAITMSRPGTNHGRMKISFSSAQQRWPGSRLDLRRLTQNRRVNEQRKTPSTRRTSANHHRRSS